MEISLRSVVAAAILLVTLTATAPAVASSDRADLRVKKVANPPATALPGASFDVHDTVKNAGAAKAETTRSAYYLAVRPKRQASWIPIGTRKVRALKPGKRSRGAGVARLGHAKLAAGVELGSYYLVGCTDSGTEVDEGDETNNCRAAPSQTEVVAPDQPPPGCTPTSGRVEGINVSTAQGSIDFMQVAQSGVEFVYARATDGLGSDQMYATYAAGAKAADLDFGAYHYLDPSASPTAQANAFLSTSGVASGDLRPTLVVPTQSAQSGSTITSRVTTWLKKVRAAVGVQPLIYTNPGFWDTSVRDSGLAAQGYPLWIGGALDPPRVPAEWKTWTIWNFSETGRVGGIRGPVDLNVFAGGDICEIAVP